MNAALQNEIDPAAVGAAPGHGSHQNLGDAEMNTQIHITTEDEMPLSLMRLQDLLGEVEDWFEAIYMAAAGINDSPATTVFQRLAEHGKDLNRDAIRRVKALRDEMRAGQ